MKLSRQVNFGVAKMGHNNFVEKQGCNTNKVVLGEVGDGGEFEEVRPHTSVLPVHVTVHHSDYDSVRNCRDLERGTTC